MPAPGVRTLPLIAVPAPLPAAHEHERRAQALATLSPEIGACTKCVAAGHLAHAEPVARVGGRIGDRLMIVGQAPGRLTIERGMMFAGPSGPMLDNWLVRAGFAPGALRREVYLSALTRCDPGKAPRGSGDRKPSPSELALCRPYLLRELELVRPRAILPVGGMAITAFLGPQRLEEVVGRSFERNGVHLLPLPHPSGVSRWLNDPAHQALLAQALALLADWRRAWENEGP